jgi:hypothetical protein
LLDHRREERARDTDQGRHVDRDLPLDQRRILAGQRTSGAESGIVDHCVDRGRRAEAFGQDGADAGLGQVEHEGSRLDPVG